MSLTVGTDTYVSLASADTYFENRLYSDEWTAASDEDKEFALKQATKMIDRFSFIGAITSLGQILSWPRIGVVDKEGRVVGQSTVPTEILDAACELAFAIIKKDYVSDSDQAGIREIEAGSVRIRWEGSATIRRLPTVVREILLPYVTTGPNPSQSILVRS